MQIAEAVEKLKGIGQEHLLHSFESLDHAQQQELLEQIKSIDLSVFRSQQKLLSTPQSKKKKIFDPLTDYSVSGHSQDYELGKKLLAKGQAGCLIVAGGQGTRLRFEGPKGMFPISPIRNKSLFQLVAEKISAASSQAGVSLPAAIMTSPSNHSETISFFEEHSYFGLKKDQISFFQQGELPLLNAEGNLFLEEPHKMAMGPDGNGSALMHFYKEGLWAKWLKRGVKWINFILIDNPLADPFDVELIGFHQRHAGDVVIKCTLRRDAQEKVGILVKEKDKVSVIEYSELPETEKGGRLCANLSLFTFDMDFVRRIANADMPLHIAHKAICVMGIHPQQPNAWKFEKFIFDVLSFAKRTSVLLYPREHCFAPLKNSSGDASPELVKAALQARDRDIFTQITGKEPPEVPFELSQEFYYPTPALLNKWRGKDLPPGANYLEV